MIELRHLKGGVDPTKDAFADGKCETSLGEHAIESISQRRRERILRSRTCLKWAGCDISLPSIELNLDLSRFGIEDAFGSASVTSLGMLGIDQAFPPITPLGRDCVGLAVGTIRDKPVAEGGRALVRPVLPIVAVIDHRVLDGFQAARLAASFRSILEDPAKSLEDSTPNVSPTVDALGSEP